MDENIETCAEYAAHQDVVADIRRRMPAPEVFHRASDFFKALSDETRARIIWALDQSEMCVCDLAEALGMTSSAISHQLSTLRGANMVVCRRAGKEVFYSLADEHVRNMLEAGIDHTHK